MSKSILNNNDTFQKVIDVYKQAQNRTVDVYSEILGLEIINLVGVFSPVNFPPNTIISTQVFARALPEIVKNFSLLEIGCGTGIISLCVALKSQNPENILATDTNPKAVENTKLNFKSYNVPAQAKQSDLFDQLSYSDKFDFIFWNHPFSDLDVSDLITDQAIASGGFDHNYNSLERYFKDASKHLTQDGKLLLGTNLDVGNWSKILKISQKYGWGNYKILYSQAVLSYVDSSISTTLAIMEFCR
jgi:release factor glutamine methyltransferase